jgi:RNA polymerase-binding transcription factor
MRSRNTVTPQSSPAVNERGETGQKGHEPFGSTHFIKRGILETEKREKLKDHIKKKIEDLKENITSYRTLTQPIPPDNAIGRLSRMEAINSKSINEAALNKAKQTLSKMELALTMIDTSDFGLCRECEEPIPFARLMIVPESDLCVKCAEAMGG